MIKLLGLPSKILMKDIKDAKLRAYLKKLDKESERKDLS